MLLSMPELSGVLLSNLGVKSLRAGLCTSSRVSTNHRSITQSLPVSLEGKHTRTARCAWGQPGEERRAHSTSPCTLGGFSQKGFSENPVHEGPSV